MSLGPQEERTLQLKTMSARKYSSQDIGQMGYQPQFGFSRQYQENRPPLQRTQPQYSGAGLGLTAASQPISQFQIQRQQDEIKHLKLIIDRLSNKLKEYQQQFKLPEEDIHRLMIEQPSTIEREVFQQVLGDPYTSMLSSHLLGPLFLEYESQISSLERELKSSKLEIQRQAEEIRLFVQENYELTHRLEVQQREYLKLVEETRENADILAMRTGNLRSTEGDKQEQIVDEMKELRDRVHLLTEENHVLFEQITLLRSHYDKYNEEITVKMQEADYKSQAYDILHTDFFKLQQENEQLEQSNVFLDRKLTETSQILGVIEEERRQDQQELKTMREQLSTFQREYVFYKNMAERLEFKQQDEVETLHIQVRELTEREKDLKMQLQDQERQNIDLCQQNRQVIADIQRLQRDLKQIMQVNDEFQMQASQFKDRELQFNELAREYRERLEQLKFERERLAMKEEQFLRQVQKTESQAKSDNKRYQDKYESMIHTRQREYERKVEELEEKLNRSQDEVDEYKRKFERIDKQNWEQRRQLDDIAKKEERTQTQYERIIEQLKNEIKDKEREINDKEVKQQYQRQEIVKENKDFENKYNEIREKYDKLERDYQEKQRELMRAKEELPLLKASVQEADKNREILIKEISNSKDQENVKIKDIERKKDAEIKLLEKQYESLRKDKKEVEQRLEEAITKQDIITSKYAEEHHNTVKYFENLIANYRIQLQRFQQPDRDSSIKEQQQ